jgi:glucose-1-phosphate cytidylyltransferase
MALPAAEIPVVILCGGKGTRLREETEYKPKPMVEIGGRPILWHVMANYAAAGFRTFVLCLGYRGEMIREYFLHYRAMERDFTVHLGEAAEIDYDARRDVLDGCRVTLAETGIETLTGGRIARAARHIAAERFVLAYGDAVTDLDPADVLRFHESHGAIGTVTVVNPRSRFGLTELDGEVVRSFHEKPELEGWVSTGNFVFEREILDRLQGGDVMLEDQPLRSLAADGGLRAFRHHGFWQPMDTFREYQLLNELWSRDAPWVRTPAQR